MFEEYINQLYSTPDKPTEYETLNIGNTVRTPFILEEKLRNISNMPNDELYEILSLGYSTILNKDFIEENEDNTVVPGAYDKGNAHDARRRRTVRRRDNRA